MLCSCNCNIVTVVKTGLLIFRGKKKQNFAGFAGANLRKNRPISRDFRGKKVKFRRIFGGKFTGGNFAKKQSVKSRRFRWIFFGKFC